MSANRSGTITSGGASQTLMNANARRRGFWVQNNSTGDLWIDRVADAAASQPAQKIPPGALYETPTWESPKGKITIFGATTGQAFSAYEVY